MITLHVICQNTTISSAVRFDFSHKPGISNLLVIYSAVTGISIETLVNNYACSNYQSFKKDVAAAVIEFIMPIKKQVNFFLADPGELQSILIAGAKFAKETASKTISLVYKKIGFLEKF